MHFGEGAYDETEDVLRKLLGVDADSPRADDGGDDPDAPDLRQLTPELYLGDLRGTTASPQGLSDPDGDGMPGGDGHLHGARRAVPADTFALDGALDDRRPSRPPPSSPAPPSSCATGARRSTWCWPRAGPGPRR